MQARRAPPATTASRRVSPCGRRDADRRRIGAAGLDAQRRAHGLDPAVAEPVAGPGAHEVTPAQVAARGAPSTRTTGEAAEHRGGHGTPTLPLARSAAAAISSATRARRDLERLAVGVDAAAQVVEDTQPVRPEREVDLTDPPGRARRCR